MKAKEKDAKIPGPIGPGLIEARRAYVGMIASFEIPGPIGPGLIEAWVPSPSLSSDWVSIPGPIGPGLIEA